MKIALVQIKSEPGEIARNAREMKKFIAKAKQNRAEIICFPELNITGYINPQKYPQGILDLKNNGIQKIVQLSAKNKLVIIAGLAEKSAETKPLISQLVATNGRIIGVYRKQIIKDKETSWYSAGKRNIIFEYKSKEFGIAICADIDEPIIFKKYKEMGADFVFVCAAPDLYGTRNPRDWQKGYLWWQNNLKEKVGKYAKEYGLYIGVSTAAGRTKDADFPGGGYVFSPKGDLVTSTKNWEEGILYFDLV